MQSAHIDVVLPCLNEAAALPWVLSRFPDGYRAIVVDNGSTDGSADIARALGAVVISEPRRGFGAACHAGVLAATSPVVCVMDVDASLDPAELPLVATPVVESRADIVLGRRVPIQRSAWPVHARVANAVLARQISRATGWQLRDLGPMRAFRRDAVLELNLTDRRFGYPLQMVTWGAAQSWRLLEVPVAYRPRIGRSKVTGTWTGTVKTIKDMRAVLAS
jgi:glycosyltransferase involved in cell wall biosynthesis